MYICMYVLCMYSVYKVDYRGAAASKKEKERGRVKNEGKLLKEGRSGKISKTEENVHEECKCSSKRRGRGNLVSDHNIYPWLQDVRGIFVCKYAWI